MVSKVLGNYCLHNNPYCIGHLVPDHNTYGDSYKVSNRISDQNANPGTDRNVFWRSNSGQYVDANKPSFTIANNNTNYLAL